MFYNKFYLLIFTAKLLLHMIILNGKTAAESIKYSLKNQLTPFINKGLRKPHLAAILIGNNGASEIYVASKVKNCGEIGFESTLIRFDENISEEELIKKIYQLNENDGVDGILVQLPLPKHIDENNIIISIDPKKDVDGFHPYNAGNLVLGNPTFIPATPYGIMLMLEFYRIETKGKNAVVIGRSNIAGRPMSILLSSNLPYGNCTVTVCHSQTKNIKEICLQSDIIVAALGKPGFVTGEMVKDGAVVIDVGITRVDNASAKKGYSIQGDVAYNEVAPRAMAITPVPGGVGLMTIAGLLKNTMQAYLQNNNLLT